MESNKKNSIQDSYDKVRVNGWAHGKKSSRRVCIAVRELSYGDAPIAETVLTVKEAKQLITLIENAIKEASKKEKN